LQDAEALVLIRERTRITAELLERLPYLRLISQTGRGITHIDLVACTRQGVAVATGSGSPHAPAELTWGLILAAMRHIPQEVSRLRTGHWQTTLGYGLYGRTLGILGYGKIGKVIAHYGRAFGMQVLAWGRAGSLTRARDDGFATASSQRELFERADVLSVHLKLVEETRGIVTAADLAAMKPSALFVNTSRAGLVEPGALAAALHAGRPGMAALDVYEDEPALDYPLLSLENMVCTPHLGYVERSAFEQFFARAFAQVNAYAAGAPVDVRNPEALRPQAQEGSVSP